MSGSSTTVSTQAELNAAIEALDQQSAPGDYTIKIAADITEGDPSQPTGIYAIDLASGVTLTIDGGNHILNGAGANGGLAVLGGKVSISDLTIEDTVAQGGDGDGSGGGGAGMGGGLFVGPGGVVTIDNLQFVNDSAVGGKGGAGGGGGGGGNASLLYAPLGFAGSTGAAGTDGQDAETPFTVGGSGGPGSSGGAGGYGGDGGSGGDGGAGGKAAAGTVASNYTGGRGGTGGQGAPGGSGGPGGKGGDGGAGGDGADGGDGTQPPKDWPRFAGAPTRGARGGNAASGGVGGYGGGGGAGGDGGGGGKGGNAPPANTAVAGKAGGTGGAGGKGATGGAGGFGAGGGGGGKGGDGGDGGDGGVGGKGGLTRAKTGGAHVGGAPINIVQAAGTSYFPPGVGGSGGPGGAGGSGGHGGVGGFGGGGGGGGVGGAGGKGGQGGAGGTPGGSPYPTAAAGGTGATALSGGGGTGAGGGFGGGAGAGAGGPLQGAGGGGLGAGGDIFVASGGVLVVEGGSTAGAATGGDAGGSGATAGQGYGGAIFLQGDQSITLAASTLGPTGTTDFTGLSVYNDITDETAHGGVGSGSVVISGSGVVTLWAASDYTGGTKIESGDLVLNAAGALGSGVVDFTNKAGATLTFNRTYANAAVGAPTNLIEGFAADDAIIMYGIAATSADYTNGLLTLFGQDHGDDVSVTLHLAGPYVTDDFTYSTTTFPDGTGSTVLHVDTPPPGTTFSYLGGTDDFTNAAAWIDNFGANGAPGPNARTLFPNGGVLTGAGSVAEMNVSSAASFAGAFTTEKLFVQNGALGLASGSLTTRLASIADDSATSGSLALNGAGNLFTATGGVVDGGAGAGSIAIAPGASASIGGGLTLGAVNGGSGTLTLTGDGDNALTAALTVASAIVIGSAASPTASQLTMNNLATLTTGNATLGQAAGSDGEATLNIGFSGKFLGGYAPTWTVKGKLVVGAYGVGALTENGNQFEQIYPTVAVSGFVDIGQFAGSTGTVTMTTANLTTQRSLIVGDRGDGTLAGSNVYANRNIYIGKNASGVGHATFDGGAIQARNGQLIVGGFGQGTLALSNNGFAAGRVVDVGAGAGGIGVLTLDHGRLDAGILVVGNAGTGTLTAANFSTLTASGGIGGLRVIVGAKNVGALNLQSNSKLTTSGSVEIGQFASGHGAITIDGAGSSLTASSNFPATLLPNSALIDGDAGVGDLKITNAGAASFAGLNLLGARNGGTGTLEVESGGSASFGIFLNLGYVLGATGKATVTGANSLLTVTGALNIGDGGSGELDILAGGKASAANLASGANYVALGGGNGASGVLLVDGAGSRFDIASDIVVGAAAGGHGGLTVSNGAVLNDVGALFSGFGAGSQATLDVQSGGSLIVGDILHLAQDLGSTATLTVGAAASVTAVSLDVGAAGGGAASVSIAAGGSISAISAEVFSGDTISLTGGQLLTDPITIDSGGAISGFGKITGDIANAGGITASGGLLDITGNVGGQLTISQGATLQLDKAVLAGASIQFAAGGDETLIIGDAAHFAASAIHGFAAGDKIDLTGFSYAGPSTVTLGPTDVLTLAKVGGGSINLTFADDDIGTLFTIVSDNAGGVFVTDNVACFARGTSIETMDGEVAVEVLRVGDAVVLASGGQRPVVWIGHRTLDTSKYRAPEDVWPVCVRAHAFGQDLPRRDLWLSPGHNVAVDGALMPISVLINGRSIVQVQQERIEYWHVELDAHDVLLAEGLPAESYLDCGNRTGFANGGAFVEAHPDFKPKHWAETCLPLVTDGPQVARARARLLARLDKQGLRVTHEAGAHVVVDGRRIEPMRLSPTRLAFVLPADGREIALRSRVFVPAHTIPESTDTRELGLCVGRLQIDGVPVELAAGDLPGWRDAECVEGGFAYRWTTGATPLAPAARIVVLDLAGVGHYWRDRTDDVAARLA